MTRLEAIEKLTNNDLEYIKKEVFLEISNELHNNIEKLSEDFNRSIVKSLEKIKQLQKENSLAEIEHINIVLPRIDIKEKSYVFPIVATNGLWWLDVNHTEVGSFDGTFFFGYYSKMLDYLEKERKKYIGKTIKQDVENVMFDQLEEFIFFIAQVGKYGILKVSDSDLFKEINKGSKIEIYIGEYMDFAVPIFFEDYERNLEDLYEKVLQRDEEGLGIADLKYLKLPNKILSESDLRLSDIRFSDFENSDLSYSMLIGAIFNQSNLKNVNFNYCNINECSFEEANLENATFKKSIGYYGYQDNIVSDIATFLRLNFKKANLTNANFESADLTGANFEEAYLENVTFEGAKLEHAIFQNAIMLGTVFSEKQVKKLKLSTKQLEDIKIIN